MGNNPTPSEMYSISDVAKNKWIMVGRSSIYKLIRAGKLQAISVSSGPSDKRYAILGQAIFDYREANKVQN